MSPSDWINIGGFVAVIAFLWSLHRDIAGLRERMASLEADLRERIARLEADMRERIARIEGLLEGRREPANRTDTP